MMIGIATNHYRIPETMSGNNSLRIGLFGAGAVGGGVVELVEKYSKNGRFAAMGIEVQIVKIFVRSLEKHRDFTLPSSASVIAGNIDDVLNDDSINCIVEVMGGVDLAKDVVFKAISLNKHVITANKALVAGFTTEIEQLLATHPTVRFGYEASVCGGIPLIQTLQRTFCADTVLSMRGIMNGTTNFILSSMVQDATLSYQDVVQEAQRLGYAEADPSADVEGWDVQSKMMICTKLALGFNFHATPGMRPACNGITRITQADFAFAKKQLGGTIKLLGNLSSLPSDSEEQTNFSVYVTPTVVPLTSAWATVSGPGNLVHLQSENLGDLWLSGAGAGRFPTANSILADILHIATSIKANASSVAPLAFPMPSNPKLHFSENYFAQFYVRCFVSSVDAGDAAMAQIMQLCVKAGVSVKCIQCVRLTSGADPAMVVVMTQTNTAHQNVQSLVQSITDESHSVNARSGILVMSIL